MLQGIGFMVSLMVYSAFLYRLMTQKLPKESLRPAMFISVGPSGFTITALIQMGQQMPRVVDKDFMGLGQGQFAGQVTMIMANWAGMWLWGLAIWLFLISVGAHFSCAARGKMDFAMTWYSFVFPNTALTTATFAVSFALHGDLTTSPHFSRGARPFQILGCIMMVALVITWFFVFGMMIRAVILKHILWPQKQEDRQVSQQVSHELQTLTMRTETKADGARTRSFAKAKSIVIYLMCKRTPCIEIQGRATCHISS